MKKRWQLCEMKEVLASAAIVIIVRCPSVASQHVAHFKLTHCDVYFISMRTQEGDWYWTGNQHAIDTPLILNLQFYSRPLHRLKVSLQSVPCCQSSLELHSPLSLGSSFADLWHHLLLRHTFSALSLQGLFDSQIPLPFYCKSKAMVPNVSFSSSSFFF